ncbi:MAG TPA: ATP phosphoribosyltransferase [Kiritimatiellia bacterium]|nr:ATP phosphoribosyltransferase [Kiritimatiellia bacterium]HNR93983.1 ATP phosphoribosyltransferase [Kiritimatiellia bacterium]HNS80292.1 ATP phosphoribosyltransferase [Kiritimatiellia bacterium]HPA77836.1 ATP phosphoribosyltransferase [Kiritimatiellia bacterium]HQQ04493.1 ATP phosphoribosyltransferase [Kiritimatiellia bacterium]
MNKIVLGLPKGSLQETTFLLMKKAGFSIKLGSRSYVPVVDDPEIEARLIRAQEISRYVEHGMLDVGMTGHDWILENGSDVVEVTDLVYAKQGMRPVRWVLAVPNDSPIQSVKDLQGKRIATEAVGLTKRYLDKNKVKAEVEFSWGATEVKAPELVDAIVEITETGSSLRANNLRIVETVQESTTRLIANKAAWADKWKKQKISQLALLLNGALAAESRVLLKMNVNRDNLDTVTRLLPSLHAPTVSALSSDGWCSVESVVEESFVREILPQLKAAGAEGIIEIGLNKVIP